MSEPKKWNRERTRCLLRFAEKNSGPWDWDDFPQISWQFGCVPGEEDVDLVIAAPEMLEFIKKVQSGVLTDSAANGSMYATELYYEAEEIIRKATGDE